MQYQFQEHITKTFPKLATQNLLVAVSGGIDSVVLTHLCVLSNFNIALAHCNFNLRGDESDADASFVEDLAQSLNLRLHLESFDTKQYAVDHKLSTQVAARQLRYQWFNELVKENNYEAVLTAHHLNDSIETFLINLSRGTGLDGLTGVPEKNNVVIRPLLPFSREDINGFAAKHNYTWREDSSNASDAYLRNAIRHHIVPKLEELNPQFLQNIQTTFGHLKQSAALIEDYSHIIFKDVMRRTHNSYALSLEKLERYDNKDAVLYQLLKDFGFSDWQAVVDLLEAQSGKYVSSKSYRLIKHKNELLLTEQGTLNLDVKLIESIDHNVTYSQGDLNFKIVPSLEEFNRFTAYVDLNDVDFPLTLRPWQPGDRFQPFGMTGSKKLSDFFNDENLSLPQKEKVYVLTSNNQIVWVVGYRASNQYRITKNTSKILKIIWQPLDNV